MASQPLTSVILVLIIVSVFESSASLESAISLSTTTLIDRQSQNDDNLYCSSWRLAVEADNAGSFSQIPSRCVSFIKDYMTGRRYGSDCEVVNNYSLAYASTVQIASDGKDAWVFDVDETLLSNLPYYLAIGFGSAIFNETSWDEWVNSGAAPAIPSSLKLYNELKKMGFNIFVITGRGESQRRDTAKNLELTGFTDWKGLILRGTSEEGIPATAYKSARRSVLANGGYRIHGSSGDQWSDLQGFAVAKRSFKIPNPIYYIA